MKTPSASTMMLVWWCVMVMMVLLLLAVDADECDEETRYKGSNNTVSYDLLKFSGCYPKFLTRIRNKVQAPTRACGFPSTREIPLPGKEYLTVELKFSNRKWLTLGLDVKDLYIWGYQDIYNGALRATFVNDTPDAARTSLFPSAVIKRNTTFKGHYMSLEQYAKIDKTSQALTIGSLCGAINQVYGKPDTQLNNANEAKFFLLVIQMVSEATRFKFIGEAIKDEGDQPESFKLKLSDYVNDWDKISKAIHKSEIQPIDKCTVINPPLVIGGSRIVTQMEELKKDMALLYYNKTLPAFSESYAFM